MKSGLIRNLDSLGRIVIPMEMRRSLDIKEGDPIEISYEDGGIRLEKPINNCIFCGITERLTKFKGQTVCLSCARQLGRD